MKRPIFVWTLCLFGFALVACDDATESTPDAVTEELSTPDVDAEVAGLDANEAESDAATEADGEGSDAAEEALVEDADASAAEAGDVSESESDAEVAEEELADSEGTEEEGLLTIAETATAHPDLSILVQAANLTGLATPLSKPDADYTVFAPTDAAFEALPEGELDALLADTDALAQILLYHAVFQTFMAEELMALETVEVLTALNIDLEVVDGVLVLNGVAKVIEADIACSNGVIHIIDTVLTVPAQ